MATKERQESYRNRRNEAGDTRLCVWISRECKDALLSITGYLEVSQKHLVERLIKQAAKVLASS